MRTQVIACVIVAATAIISGSGDSVLADPQEKPAVPHAPREFDAASVKRNTSGARQRSLGFEPGNRFVARNMPLRFVIGRAYGEGAPLPPYLIDGAPGWIETEPYDIEAVADRASLEGLDDAERTEVLLEMLRSLLAERFNLRAHREPRERPAYLLVRARSDGGLGRALNRSTSADCVSPSSRPAGGDTLPTCGAGPMDRGVLAGYGMTMSEIARTFQSYLDRPVLDRTTLDGRFTFTLSFALELPGGQPPESDTSIFSALPEQLGLKLDPQRAFVGVLMIDAVERPAAD